VSALLPPLTNSSAIENLNVQYEAVVNGKHESLVWMLAELDRRRDLQLARLEARHA